MIFFSITCSLVDVYTKHIRKHKVHFTNQRPKWGLNPPNVFKTYNGYILIDDWIDLNVQQNFNSRNNKVQINDY